MTSTDGRTDSRQRVAKLVSEFRELRQAHEMNGRSEAQARTWVERLLGAFGWNTADPRQVIQEYNIRGREARRLVREGSSRRRPDYVLVVGGQRLLYIDAKRFDVDIKEDHTTAEQIRMYGWSAGMRLSYACDFEELAIYDCRVKPEDGDEATVARVKYFHFEEYVSRFDELSQYLSREAIESGSLLRLHPDDEKPKGYLPLDQDFEDKLSFWRKEIAKTIMRHGKVRDARILSAAAQRILDRIVFIRFCEEIGLEELGTLGSFGRSEDGFWPLFLEECEKRWRHVYDGILFPHSEEDDPTGVESHIKQWWLKGRIFREITQTLYFPQPYKFDAIPLELLGGIYERYLGKRLRVIGNDVTDEFKPEHQRTKGAVYTPSWVVQRVVSRTLSPLTEGRTPSEILGLRILDPACGSGGFLLGVYDYLERAALDWCAANPDNPETKSYATYGSEGWRLTRASARSIVEECLHGVDIDAEAVEVARMSLALRYVERTAVDEANEPHDLLRGIGRNIRHGNSIVGPEMMGLGFDVAAIRDVMPFDWRDDRRGFGAVMKAGGFDAVVGNPPYIEVKRYKEWMPEMYKYLKNGDAYETTAKGKTDISMPFIERAVSLLGPKGRLGFIVQNRFFKTDYGELTRRWLAKNTLLEEIEDFRDVQVFAGRTTYTAILVLRRGSTEMRYRTYMDLAAAQAGKTCVDYVMPAKKVASDVWSFDQPDLADLHATLAKRHGAIGDHKEISITVGLQTLWGKLYQIAPIEEGPRIVRGVNGLGEEVRLDRAALRPLCRNRGFYPLRRNNADAWVIFPYEIENGEAREIRWREFEERFRRTAGYLDDHKKELKAAVEVPSGADRWHLYTRPQNLVTQAHPKLMFPSTIEDTMAAFDILGDVYQDNVRIQGLNIGGADVDLRVVAAVFNSTLFSALARLKAGLSDSGWRQLNRQYIQLVPFPLAAIRKPGASRQLAELADRIQSIQEEIRGSRTNGEGALGAVDSGLAHLWSELDRAVEDLYGLTAEERDIASRYPRRVDRVEMLHRQLKNAIEPGEEDEED